MIQLCSEISFFQYQKNSGKESRADSMELTEKQGFFVRQKVRFLD